MQGVLLAIELESWLLLNKLYYDLQMIQQNLLKKLQNYSKQVLTFQTKEQTRRELVRRAKFLLIQLEIAQLDSIRVEGW
jgi:hypothetical protein